MPFTLLGLAGRPAGEVLAGVERDLHSNDLITPDALVPAARVMVQWNLHGSCRRSRP